MYPKLILEEQVRNRKMNRHLVSRSLNTPLCVALAGSKGWPGGTGGVGHLKKQPALALLQPRLATAASTRLEQEITREPKAARPDPGGCKGSESTKLPPLPSSSRLGVGVIWRHRRAGRTASTILAKYGQLPPSDSAKINSTKPPRTL